MRISELIQPDHVHVDLAYSSKTQVLQGLARKATVALGLPEAAILEPLAAREKLGSTGIGGGIAIPHTRIAGLSKPFGLVARLKKAVDFDSIDEVPVDMVFLLLIPNLPSENHRNALACVARRLREDGVLKKLRAAPNARELFAWLVENHLDAERWFFDLGIDS